MELHITNTELNIQLNWQERLWAFHVGETITIPIQTIGVVSTQQPEMEWYALRAPGTAVPGRFTVGTYYAKRGREFWYVTQRSNFLVLDINEGYYKRVVLTLDDHIRYADQISEAKAHDSAG
ncbi:MAG: hypothetical protein AAFR31_16660 [Cyanobacteria bacterium J06627_8]